MIHISPKTFDIESSLAITPLPRGVDFPMARRVSRSATLDQGVAINDRGFSHGDRTLAITYRPVSAAHDAIARRLLTLHSRVIVTMPEGVFEAAPQDFAPTPAENIFTLLIIDKLSED